MAAKVTSQPEDMAPFRVAIAGGGVTGLTIALHLDKLGIDFVLLEGHDEIAPEVGASIGLAPNALQLLKLLGLHDTVLSVSVPIADIEVRDGDGRMLYHHRVLEPISNKSAGGCVAFLERSRFLRILYDNISSAGRDKILTNQRVVKVEDHGDRVSLHCSNGSSYDADIVVGADGVHSPVRSEMWRIAKNDGSNVFDGDTGEAVTTEYGCVFGISEKTNDLKSMRDLLVHKKDWTVGIMVGAHDKPCVELQPQLDDPALLNTATNHCSDKSVWFLFWKLPETHHGLDFPRFSKEEELALCETQFDTRVSETTTFGDIYKNSYVSLATALPIHCFKRWHYKRIMLIGDSVAKMNPIAGQGACQCMETSMAFVDNLAMALKQHNGQLSSEHVDGLFARTNKQRVNRVREQAEASLQIQRVSAHSNRKNQILDTWVAPHLPTWAFVKQLLSPIADAYVPGSLKDGGVVNPEWPPAQPPPVEAKGGSSWYNKLPLFVSSGRPVGA